MRKPSTNLRRTIAAGAALAVLAVVMSAAPAQAEPTALQADGADLVAVSVAADGALSLRIRDAGQAARGEAGHEPADVLLGPGGGLAGRVPATSEFSFLGSPGQPIWSLTSGDRAFPALDATGVPRGAVVDDTVTLTLRATTGPGSFAAYTLSGLGVPKPLIGSATGLPDSVRMPAGGRTEAVWAFTAAGDYRLTFAASATLGSGRVAAVEATYQVRVPEIVPSGPAPPPAPAVPAEPAAERPDSSAARNQVLTAPEAVPVPEAAPAPEAAPLAKTAQSGSRKVIADGHVDMGPVLSGDSWTIRIKDDTVSPAVWRELADTVLHVVDKAKISVPAGPDYAFLGDQGETVWLLPQAQQSGIVWPGWNTQHESVITGTTGAVTWSLKGVSGPGQFKLFLTGSFGKPEVLFDSAEKLPQQLSIPPNTHAHGNWAFTRAGIYRLAVEMTGNTKAGKKVTDTRTLAVAVGGGTDPNAGFGPGSGNGNGNGNGGDGNGGPLPRTGTSWVIPVVGGGLLLVSGGLLLLLISRRRQTRATPSG